MRILAEADEPGARIGDVARRHDIHPGQIRLWRQSFSYAANRDVSAVSAPLNWQYFEACCLCGKVSRSI
ncbi:transposase [Brucella anthropi]|uniref:transposase n=1 Tax=Brucella anthropi TaxID=529 RepID=UPI0034E4A5D2